MKIIAFYLPQFHEIPENDEWWGEGFTEWVNVKKARPLFSGHNQPRIPLNGNYYDLSRDDVKKWQIDLAKSKGIYGFCFYHYWFNGHLLLQKPVEQFLNNTSLDFPFCICWANENWTNSWAAGGNKILIAQSYGDKEEWKLHFEYFLNFFRDERYIKEDGYPLLVIYRPDIMDNMNDIIDYWQELAIENGLPGIRIASQYSSIEDLHGDDSRLDYFIEYQPNYAARWVKGWLYNYIRVLKKRVTKIIDRKLPSKYFSTHPIEPRLEMRDYDRYWNTILEHRPLSRKQIAGAFVDWDNTPRKGERGSVCYNSSPEKFKKFFGKLLDKVNREYSTEYIFMFAWNEWAEGGYLEPDEKYGTEYLDAIHECLREIR